MSRPNWLARTVGIRLMFAWYDIWVGVFIDRAKRRIYILPLPCVGIVIDY